MFKIGIIGTENSHAKKFAQIFRDDPAFADIRLVAVGGHYAESNQAMFDEFHPDFIAEKPEDMLGKVDAVIITARDGIYHAPFARPFLEAGIPMFIDKPFTVDLNEAIDFASEAKRRGVPLIGGSILKTCYDVMLLANECKALGDTVKGGVVAAPLKIDSPYSGFFFYSSHLSEISLEVFGYDPRSITAFRKNNDVTACVEYDRYAVTNHFNGTCTSYFGQLYTDNGIYSRNLEYRMGTKVMCEAFANMLRHGVMLQSYEHLVYPVQYMNAVKEAYETGKTVYLHPIEI